MSEPTIQESRLLIDNRDNVCRRIEDVLRDGFKITLPDGREVQWHRRGVRFEDGELLVEPLETGLFQRIEGSANVPRWVHLFSLDVLEGFLNKLLDAMPRKDAEAWFVMTLANVSMSRMNQGRVAKRAASRLCGIPTSRIEHDDVEDEISSQRVA